MNGKPGKLLIGVALLAAAAGIGYSAWSRTRVSPEDRLELLPPPALMQAAQDNPRHEPTLVILGKRLLFENQLENAATAFGQAMQAEPLSIRARAGFACTAGILGDLETSDRVFRELGPEGMKTAEANLYRGFLLYSVGDPVQAISSLEIATRLRPRDAESWYWLSRCLGERGLKTEALAAAQKARTLRPDRTDYHVSAAELANIAGEADRARSELEKAITQWPESPLPKLALARILAAPSGSTPPDHKRARTLLQETLRIAPDLTDARVEYARVALALGNAEDALAALKQVPNRERGDNAYLLSQINFRLGNRAEGQRLARISQKFYRMRLGCSHQDAEALQAPNDPDLQLKMARCLSGLGQLLPALWRYRLVLSAQPANTQVRAEMEAFIHREFKGKMPSTRPAPKQ